jgi:hypothetical protein
MHSPLRVFTSVTCEFLRTLKPEALSDMQYSDYKMLRFQAVDTPGILDHALEEMSKCLPLFASKGSADLF